MVIILLVLTIAACTDFELDDEHYDRVKWIVIRWDAIVVFTGLIVKTFEIPYGVETVMIVAGIGVMLAELLDISSHNYYATTQQKEVNEDDFLEMLDYEYDYDDEDDEDDEIEEEESEVEEDENTDGAASE
jgi:hypothetical protein